MAELTPVGYTSFRNQKAKFCIKRDDRRRHMYIVGKTGCGKTTFLENLMIQDIVSGEGVGFIDAHGDTADRLLKFIPKERIDDVIYLNPHDLEWPIGFNPLETVPWELRHIVASGLMSVFKKIWIDAWSARMEYILTNTLLALLELPETTLLDINRMLADKTFRDSVVRRLKDPVVKAFWDREFARYHSTFQVEAIAPIQNKIGQFITNPLIRNIVGQVRSTINLRKIMDERKILVVNISKGAIGEDSSGLLGGMLITKLQLAAMSRVDIPETERKDFYLYIDEFQNFATEAFLGILSEARKYRLALILANQYLEQLIEEIRAAIFGNMGTIVCFRVGPLDAELLSKELVEFFPEDLVNLPKYHVYTKLLVDGMASRPFSAETFSPSPDPVVDFKSEVVKLSRLRFGQKRDVVEATVKRTFGEIAGDTKGQGQHRGEGEQRHPRDDRLPVKCSRCGASVFIAPSELEKEAILCERCAVQAPAPTISLKKAMETELVTSMKNPRRAPTSTAKEGRSLDEILSELERS